MEKGQPSPAPDTRMNHFDSRFREAVSLCQAGRWSEGLFVFGLGLHSLQDSFSHLDLTAAEHQTDYPAGPGRVPQLKCVDDPDCDRDSEKKPSPRRYKGPYPSLFGDWQVRVFSWHLGSNRFNNTESATKNAVSQFIWRVLNTPCVKIVCKKPPKLPCRSPGECGDGK